MHVGIGRWISFWARIAGGRDAIVFGGEAITYSALNRQVNQFANALHERGVRAGDRVAVLLGNRPEFLVTVLACAKLGALFVPLNVRLVPRELEYIIQDAEPRVVLSEPAFEAALDQVRSSVNPESIDGFAAHAPDQEPVAEGRGDALVICYTSGTTGLPKGAVLTNANILHGSLQEIIGYGFNSADRHLVVVPLCFSGGLITASMPVFHSGATLYLEPEFDPDAVMERIEADRITHMMGVPTMFAAMAQRPIFATADFSSLKLLLVGAAPVPAALVEIYQSRGVSGFTNAFGLTEGTAFNLFLPASDVTERPGAYVPAAYTDVRVVDVDGADVEPGGSGELLISGPCVMAGYWRDETATAAAIRDGWLYTGDLVRLGEDGYVYPIDRIKDMIISGGLNVYPAEVESVLFEHSGLTDLTVVGLPEEQWGEAVTVVAVAENDDVTADEILSFCADKLANYKRPKSVIFVDAIPRNAGGKALKRTLREQFAGHYSAPPTPSASGR